MKEAQILVGREYGERTEGRGIDFYQLMIDWELKGESRSLNLPNETLSVQINQGIAINLSEELRRMGIRTCRVYNGVRYDSETNKFIETDEPLSLLEETAIRQTLKTVGGVLAA